MRDSKDEVKLMVNRTVVNLVALATSAVMFVAIVLVAVGLGAVLTWAGTFPWMPGWVIGMGKVVEVLMFAIDLLCLLWSVGVHAFHFFHEQLKGVSKE